MTETKPKRRWFRFSLRSLFVLVTIAGIGAGWVAYQLKWIRDRHEFRGRFYVFSFVPKDYPIQPPWSLKLFGETPLIIGLKIPEAELSLARSLFPELPLEPYPPNVTLFAPKADFEKVRSQFPEAILKEL